MTIFRNERGSLICELTTRHASGAYWVHWFTTSGGGLTTIVALVASDGTLVFHPTHIKVIAEQCNLTEEAFPRFLAQMLRLSGVEANLQNPCTPHVTL